MNTTNNFEQIVLDNISLIDVRAPLEYHKGSFLNSINLPIMNDDERHQVGIRYKELGNEEATKLGYQLVSGHKKQERINAWVARINQHPNSILYCFRGGSRSKITQEWIYEASGKIVFRIEGGYKAFRNYLIESLEPINLDSIPILLGGYTGAGKSILLNNLDNYIDLEGIANHRGSSFGRHVSPQPTQINFENNLAYALIKHKHKKYKHLILEDEGSHVGKCFIPKPLYHFFNLGDLVLLDVPFDERVLNTYNEYVDLSQKEYINCYKENGLDEWANYIRDSISRIKKRLGDERFKHLLTTFELAFQTQVNTNDKTKHTSWIEILLSEYYDPMYHYQIEKTTKNILFKGNTKEVYDFLKENYS